MKEKNVKRTQEKGITLIALVVTIVVLLILAGVSITILFGDSGIITMAQKAADETNKAAEKDQEDLNKLNEYLTNGNWGGTTKPTDPEESNKTPVIEYNPNNPTKGEKVPVQSDGKTNVEWKETVDGVEKVAKIPVGFCVVKDVGEDINNITNGLVISDVANDDLDNTTKGNQFVWIPVEVDDSGNTPNFRRIEGFYDDTRQSYLTKCQESGKEGITTTESITMYQSVAENGGFYIARFEAGIPDTGNLNQSKSNVPTPDGNTKPVSKKGVSPWNFIQWGGTTAKEASDGLQGNDRENGAVKVARSMYPSTDTTYGVTSTLCYGVQWDAVMQYIEPKYKNVPATPKEETVPSDSFVRNSSNKGNYDETGSYERNLALTGSNPIYQQKHIYDLAGNVFEWTMEAYSTDWRVMRGGCSINAGSFYPVSGRNNSTPDNDYDEDTGFRAALYL